MSEVISKTKKKKERGLITLSSGKKENVVPKA